jgi:polyhydroxyalkanoate synthesis regulator phasin
MKFDRLEAELGGIDPGDRRISELSDKLDAATAELKELREQVAELTALVRQLRARDM